MEKKVIHQKNQLLATELKRWRQLKQTRKKITKLVYIQKRIEEWKTEYKKSSSYPQPPHKIQRTSMVTKHTHAANTT